MSVFRRSVGTTYTIISSCYQYMTNPTPVSIQARPTTVLRIYTWSKVNASDYTASYFSGYTYPEQSLASALITVGRNSQTNPLYTAWEPLITLRYRQTDIPPGFTPKGAAQADPENEVSEYITTTSLSSAHRELVMAMIIALSLAFIFGIILVFMSWLRSRSRSSLRRPREKWWFLGLGVYFPTMIGIIAGTFSVMYASRKEWQEETIRYFESPNSVRLCVQAMAFIMRTCAVLLAWVTVAGIGWLTLVSSSGMGRDELLSTLDLAATGGSYSVGVRAIWHHLNAISIRQAILISLGLVFALASDLVGVSMVASTGLGESNVGTLHNRSAVPFMIANRTVVRNEGLPLIDPGSQLSSLTEKYPIILRRMEDNNIAFLPLLDNDVPDTYIGVARFGNFTSRCRPARIIGSINVDLAHTTTSITATLSDPPFEKLDSLVEQRFGFYTSTGDSWYNSGIPEHNRKLRKWDHERKIMRNFFDPRYEEGRTALAAFRLERLHKEETIPSDANDPEPTREYFFVLEMSVNRTTDFPWSDESDMAWAFDVVADQSSGHIPIYWEDSGGSNGDESQFVYTDRVYKTGEDLFWKTRVCEVELPKEWGIIEAKSIGRSSTPLTALCSGSRTTNSNYQDLSCPNITYHLSDYTTVPWTPDETINKLHTEPVAITEFNYWENILSYFTSPRIVNIFGFSYRGTLETCPDVLEYPRPGFALMDGTKFYKSLNPTLYYACNHSDWAYNETQKASYVGYDEGAVFCYTCSAARRASTLLSSHMIRAARLNNDRDFEDAFANIMMHIVAGTYEATLPRMNGFGPAVYTYLRPVTLIIEPFWIYLAVAYTTFLIIVAWIVQAWMRSVLGVDRTGSLLQSAAVIHRGPLSPLLDKNQVLGGSVVTEKGSEDGEEEKEKKLKLGVTTSGRYMVGYVDELKQPSRRLRKSGFYEVIEDLDSPKRIGSDVKFQ
ncbi:hypothetical protein EX30DRAFT_190632 [Ascodesmis nigricans]|uniref:Uncharacterized protein n=1 Tax=Ascodesmis nigricans TaxID=341454 RepID=A0A4S2N0Y1_9PEZI|nr:hypothetical protein EX30DRAFT_190632 [Ascodesmis nigricans]